MGIHTVEDRYGNRPLHSSYVITSGGRAAVIDPLRDVQQYIDFAAQKEVQISYVFLTQFHTSLVTGHVDLADKTDAMIVMGPGAVASYAFAKAEHLQSSSPSFKHLDWNQASLLIGLKKWLNDEPVVLLQKLHDLDHVEDLQLVLKARTTIDVVMLQLLRLLSFVDTMQSDLLLATPEIVFYDSQRNKGSPC